MRAELEYYDTEPRGWIGFARGLVVDSYNCAVVGRAHVSSVELTLERLLNFAMYIQHRMKKLF